MAHIHVRLRQTKAGLKWSVTQVEWVSGQNKVQEKVLTPNVFVDLGFSENMTPAQARAHAKKLNSLNDIRRKEQRQKVRASERLNDLVVIENSIVPQELSDLFIDHIRDNWFGGEYNLRKQILHWSTVQGILTKLKIQPHEYFKRKNELYKYFQKEQMSPSYVEKLLKVINQWGEFYAEHSRSFFKKVPNPRGLILENIKEASKSDGEGALPLTCEILAKMQNKMPKGQWEYLHATLWLGLRPSELDSILKDKSKFLKTESQNGVRILGIYQAKLSGVSKDMRWKWVPLFLPEMQLAYKNINEGLIRKPLVKTIQRYAPESAGGLGLYSGRKGFTDLMLSLGQSLEDISQWLGHASIERTWRHYKNKKKISFKIPSSF